MRPYDLILKKRNGAELEREEIEYLVNGYVSGRIEDYQMAAFLMAVYFRGMSPRETADLTMAMVRSGETVDLSGVDGTKVDKHSTGGVGDKTSLVLVPLVASAGVPVAKMSGRGLGHTGGTLDKLEAIPGFSVNLDRQQFLDNVRRIKAAIVGQQANLVPADGKMYALRDVTATVDSIPLIASSIMSKKIAGGADAIVLDVKVGEGAFMKSREQAAALARQMVDIGAAVGRRTVAVLSDMSQPLGRAVGNSLEVREAIDTLKGTGPADLTELCLALGGHMLALAGLAANAKQGYQVLREQLDSGAAMAKFRELVVAQGGDPRAVDDPSLLTVARNVEAVPAPREGYVKGVAAQEIGLAAMALGAGRAAKGAPIDLSVGVVVDRKIGDRVEKGEPLARVFASDPVRAAESVRRIQAAYVIGPERCPPPPLILGVIDGQAS